MTTREVRHRRPRGVRPLRAVPDLLGALLLAGGWALLLLGLVRITAAAWSAAAAPGPARPEDAVGVLAGGAAAAATVWLGLAVAAVAVAAVHPRGRAGAIAAALSRRVAPAMLRKAVALALGMTVLAGPTALAAPRRIPQAPAAAAATVAGGLLAAAPAPGAGTDLSPGWAAPTPDPLAGAPRTAAAARARDAVLDPAWSPLGPAVRASAGTSVAVVVRRGDTLWDLASRHLGPGATDAEIAREWPRWYAANAVVIGPDPDHLEPGQRLLPPGGRSAGPVTPSAAGSSTSAGEAARR